MFIRKYWIPLSVFIIAIVGVSLYYLQTRPPKEPIVIYKPVEPLPKPTVEKPEVETEAPVGDTSQGGHSHEAGTWHDQPNEAPVVSEVETTDAPVDVSVKTSEPAMALTYHAELLANDPVEALRQQGKERGHWSADYLPDFPLDDTEALEIARAEYNYIYYGHTIPVSEHGDSPEFQRAAAENRRLLEALSERYPMTSSDWHVRARHLDLWMLAWPSLEYDTDRLDKYRDYTGPSLIVRTHMYPDLPELGERR